MIAIGDVTRVTYTCPRCYLPVSLALGPLFDGEGAGMPSAVAVALHLRTGCQGVRRT